MTRTPAETLREILAEASKKKKKVMLVGMGNEVLGGDAVGQLVARDLEWKNSEFFFRFRPA